MVTGDNGMDQYPLRSSGGGTEYRMYGLRKISLVSTIEKPRQSRAHIARLLFAVSFRRSSVVIRPSQSYTAHLLLAYYVAEPERTSETTIPGLGRFPEFHTLERFVIWAVDPACFGRYGYRED